MKKQIRVLTHAGVSRRQLMKMTSAALVGSVAPNLMSSAAYASDVKGELNYMTYETFGRDVFVDNALEVLGFEIKPTVAANADEMVAKLRAGAKGQFDFITPVHTHVKVMAKLGLIQPVDSSKLTNFNQVYPEFQNMEAWNPGGECYGMPGIWGANAIAFNREMTGEIDSIDALFDPKFKGKIGMHNAYWSSLIVAAFKLGIEKPFAMDEAELQECKKLLIAQKPLVRTYWSNIAEVRSALGSGELALAFTFLSVVAPLRKAGLDIGWVWPKEGAVGWTDGFSIIDGTDKAEQALEYLDYAIGPDYGQVLAEKTRYATVSSEAVERLDPSFVKEIGMDVSQLDKLTFLDIPDNEVRYQEIWNEVRNA